jgi:hypothetical protein
MMMEVERKSAVADEPLFFLQPPNQFLQLFGFTVSK